ncbi:MAG: hypothetical protein J5449_00760, partial [Oscillospiraceae bacterium]|nr:hypothetical protein [Oscillospiraceae bacterium]
KEGDTASINTADEKSAKPIIIGNNYYMLITGRYTSTSANASGDSFAFRAASPVYATDDTPPKLVSITGTVNITEFDDKGNPLTTPKVAGEITLLFDKELYYYNNSDPLNRFPIHLYAENGEGSGGTPEPDVVSGKVTFRSVKRLINSMNGFTMEVSASNKCQRTNKIVLKFSDNNKYPYIQLINYIASETSKSRNEGIDFRINLDGVENGPLPKTAYSFTGPSDIWLNNEQINITANVPPGPVQSISLSTSYMELCTASIPSLNLTNVAQITATAIPTNPTNKIVKWTQTSADGGTVAVQSTSAFGETISITALTAGTVQLTATSTSDNTKFATCTIKITAPPSPVIQLTPAYELDVTKGETSVLRAELLNYFGTDDYSFEAVAKVDGTSTGQVQVAMTNERGVWNIKGVAEGTVTVQVTVRSNSDPTLATVQAQRITVVILAPTP